MPRPVGGSLKLSLQEVNKLPDAAPMNVVAKQLGITAPTIRNWCLLQGLPYTKERSVYLIKRTDLMQWLVNTGRCAIDTETPNES